MKRYLVTGGAGFIGSNLVRRLLSQDHENNVHIIVEPGADLWRLQDIRSQITLHYADLIAFEEIQKIVLMVKPHVIYHLAAFGGMPQEQDAKLIYKVNFEGTQNLLESAEKVGFECFINTGSSSEYGMQEHPMREDRCPEPVSDYAVAKVAATSYCFKKAAFDKLPVYTVRPFSVYGDFEHPQRLIPTLARACLERSPVALSTPYSVRDFIYIDDMIDLFVTVEQHKPQHHFIFNGGTGIQSSIGDVVKTIEQIAGQQFDITWGSAGSRPWEPKQWRADIERASTVLKWQPAYSLSMGLAKTLNWFARYYGLSAARENVRAQSINN